MCFIFMWYLYGCVCMRVDLCRHKILSLLSVEFVFVVHFLNWTKCVLHSPTWCLCLFSLISLRLLLVLLPDDNMMVYLNREKYTRKVAIKWDYRHYSHLKLLQNDLQHAHTKQCPVSCLFSSDTHRQIFYGTVKKSDLFILTYNNVYSIMWAVLFVKR